MGPSVMQQVKSTNRAAKRHQKKLARKAAKNRRGRPPQSLGQGLGAAPANRNSELVQKGTRLHQAGQVQEAETIYRQVLATDPNHADANYLLGVLLYQAGNHAQAVDLISRAIATAPDQPMYHNNLGNMHQELGRLEEAVASYRKALVIKPDYAAAHSNLGNALQELGRLEEAVASYRKALVIKPDYAAAHSNLGTAHQELGRLEEAVASSRKALVIEPSYAEAHNNLGTAHMRMGRLEEAVAGYRKALVIKPDYAESYMHLAHIKEHFECDNEIKAMEEKYASPDISDEQRMYLAFGLGKAFEDLRQYEKAFDFFLAGNTIKRKTQSYSIEAQDLFFKKQKEVFDSSLFEKYRGAGCEDDSPIFVLGMPRSGSTLIEQILASHAQVYGAGEVTALPQIMFPFFNRFSSVALAEGIRECDAAEFERMGVEYIDAIKKHSKKARFTTDKALSNFQFIGMIRLILPNAKIIHCCRNPLDNCLSIFKSQFVRSGFEYAYDLIELGRYYNLYRDLMKYWHSVLPDFIYNIQYEEMVADQAEQTRLLLKHCGLEWEDACLEFYKTNRPVATASAVQVRRPIYKNSVQSWKRYEKQLAPLLEILG